MFLHRTDGASYLIPQVSHAWLAWQIASHWGNRAFSRPAPRAEVLAAVLLHDGGWSEADAHPELDADGRPLTFDRMPSARRLEIWRSSVLRAAMHCRYAGLLVSHHFAVMAADASSSALAGGDTDAARRTEAFRAEMERLQAAWREDLAEDARYQAYLDGPGWLANTVLLRACDRVSVWLCARLESPFTVDGHTAAGKGRAVRLEAVGGDRWKVSPWPLQGDRIRLQCEGWRLPEAEAASGRSLHDIVKAGPATRLSFTLLRPSARG